PFEASGTHPPGHDLPLCYPKPGVSRNVGRAGARLEVLRSRVPLLLWGTNVRGGPIFRVSCRKVPRAGLNYSFIADTLAAVRTVATAPAHLARLPPPRSPPNPPPITPLPPPLPPLLLPPPP